MNVSISLSRVSLDGTVLFAPPRPRPLPRPLTTFLPLVAAPLAAPLPRPLATPRTTLPPRTPRLAPLFMILPPRGRDMEALRPLLPTEAELKQSQSDLVLSFSLSQAYRVLALAVMPPP